MPNMLFWPWQGNFIQAEWMSLEFQAYCNFISCQVKRSCYWQTRRCTGLPWNPYWESTGQTSMARLRPKSILQSDPDKANLVLMFLEARLYWEFFMFLCQPLLSWKDSLWPKLQFQQFFLTNEIGGLWLLSIILNQDLWGPFKKQLEGSSSQDLVSTFPFPSSSPAMLPLPFSLRSTKGPSSVSVTCLLSHPSPAGSLLLLL